MKIPPPPRNGPYLLFTPPIERIPVEPLGPCGLVKGDFMCLPYMKSKFFRTGRFQPLNKLRKGTLEMQPTIRKTGEAGD